MMAVGEPTVCVRPGTDFHDGVSESDRTTYHAYAHKATSAIPFATFEVRARGTILLLRGFAGFGRQLARCKRTAPCRLSGRVDLGMAHKGDAVFNRQTLGLDIAVDTR